MRSYDVRRMVSRMLATTVGWRFEPVSITMVLLIGVRWDVGVGSKCCHNIHRLRVIDHADVGWMRWGLIQRLEGGRWGLVNSLSKSGWD